jgi:hypothetical protein
MREEEAFVAFVVILCGSGLAWAVIRHLSWACRTWFETGLKRDMVARGYSAQEIIAVVKSDRHCGWRSGYSDIPPAKPIRQPAYSP